MVELIFYDKTPGVLPIGVTDHKENNKVLSDQLNEPNNASYSFAGDLQAASQAYWEEKAWPDKRVHRSVERFIAGAPKTHGKFML